MVGNREEYLEQKKSETRLVLWQNPDCVFYILPYRFKKNYVRSGEHVGGPYVRLYQPKTSNPLSVDTFMHGRSVTRLKNILHAKKPVACTVEVARNTFRGSPSLAGAVVQDRVRISIDYRVIEVPEGTPMPVETHNLRIAPNSLREIMDSTAEQVTELHDINSWLIVTDLSVLKQNIKYA